MGKSQQLVIAGAMAILGAVRLLFVIQDRHSIQAAPGNLPQRAAKNIAPVWNISYLMAAMGPRPFSIRFDTGLM